MTKKNKQLYKQFLNNFVYDYNIYTESELLNMLFKKQKMNIIYNENPEYLCVKNIKINIIKDFNKYNYHKIVEKKNEEIEPIFVKQPPLLEDYYKVKKIDFVKKQINKNNKNKKIELYEYLEKSNIINLRLKNIKEDNFNFFE